MPVRVVVVGCGSVGRGMGWYHAKQILAGRVPNAELSGIVEPFLFGAGRATDPAVELRSWFGSHGPGVALHESLGDLQMEVDDQAIALISTRTADSPKVFREVVERGFRNVLLEKPGATTLEDLEAMAELARAKDVRVVMGYNRNVAKYVKQAREKAAELEGAQVTFVSMNAYPESELDECFERNSEGMLKNMLIHELVLMYSFFGISASAVSEVAVDRDFTSREVRSGPHSGAEFTDFRRLRFTVVSDSGARVTLLGDRCGGTTSSAEVSVGGELVSSFVRPDKEEEAAMRELEAEQPGCMPYFYSQDSDYLLLKGLFIDQILQGRPGVPEGLASIEAGVEGLRLATFLIEQLNKNLDPESQ